MNKKPFSIKYDWGDFDNSWKLTEFQKHRIRSRARQESKDFIQSIINDSVIDRKKRRSELNAHNNPEDPFKLDLGGEG